MVRLEKRICTTHSNDPYAETFDSVGRSCSGLSSEQKISIGAGMGLCAVILVAAVLVWVAKQAGNRREDREEEDHAAFSRYLQTGEGAFTRDGKGFTQLMEMKEKMGKRTSRMAGMGMFKADKGKASKYASVDPESPIRSPPSSVGHENYTPAASTATSPVRPTPVHTPYSYSGASLRAEPISPTRSLTPAVADRAPLPMLSADGRLLPPTHLSPGRPSWQQDEVPRPLPTPPLMSGITSLPPRGASLQSTAPTTTSVPVRGASLGTSSLPVTPLTPTSGVFQQQQQHPSPQHGQMIGWTNVKGMPVPSEGGIGSPELHHHMVNGDYETDLASMYYGTPDAGRQRVSELPPQLAIDIPRSLSPQSYSPTDGSSPAQRSLRLANPDLPAASSSSSSHGTMVELDSASSELHTAASSFASHISPISPGPRVMPISPAQRTALSPFGINATSPSPTPSRNRSGSAEASFPSRSPVLSRSPVTPTAQSADTYTMDSDPFQRLPPPGSAAGNYDDAYADDPEIEGQYSAHLMADTSMTSDGDADANASMESEMGKTDDFHFVPKGATRMSAALPLSAAPQVQGFSATILRSVSGEEHV